MLKHTFTVTKYVPNSKTVIWSHEFSINVPEKLTPVSEWGHIFANPEANMRDAVIKSAVIDLAGKYRGCDTKDEAIKLHKSGVKVGTKVQRVKVVEKEVHTLVRSRSEGDFTPEQMKSLRKQLGVGPEVEIRIKFID